MSVRPVSSSELSEALGWILAPPGAVRARRSQIRGFLAYLERSPCDAACLAVDERAYLLALLVPGDTAVLMISDPERDPEAHTLLLEQWLQQHASPNLYYQQCLLDPAATARHALLMQHGFDSLTTLVYLERSATYPWIEPATRPGVEWRTHEQIGDAGFAEILPRTYEDSADCPELAGRRPIDAVITSHKAAGAFDPALWQVLYLEGRAVGCLLLSRLPQASVLEVVYMGLAREARGLGLGQALLERAVVQCQVYGLGQITLVVDARNAPAQRLYGAFGFRATTERLALLRF